MKALIITGDLVQDHEFIYPYYRLLEEGFEVYVATMSYNSKGSYGTRIPPDDNSKNISLLQLKNLSGIDLLILPGGAKCMEYLRQQQEAIDYIANFTGRIGVICHGTQLLISAKRTKGLKISGYYSIKDDIINSGAEYIRDVVEDGNIVSAPHYKLMGKWMKQILMPFAQQS